MSELKEQILEELTQHYGHRGDTCASCRSKTDRIMALINPHIMALSTVLYDIASEPDIGVINWGEAAKKYNQIREKARKAIGWEPGKDRP